jgi:phospholipase A1
MEESIAWNKILKFRVVACLVFLCVIFTAFSFSIQIAAAQEDSSVKGDSGENTGAKEADEIGSERRVSLEESEGDNQFAVTLHRPNYFLPLTYNGHPNEKTYEQANEPIPNRYEAKFQLSIKMLVWENIFNGNGDLYGAYTQLSMWQIYNESSPFRETNYEPELFLKFDTDFDVLGLTNKRLIFGLNHQSNGQGGDFSRSWNRIYVEFVATKGDFMLSLKPWYRIPESDEDDDNPDIHNYLGYGQLSGAYKWRKNVWSFIFRNNLRLSENKGSIELGWSYPLTHNLRAYLQYYNGYGETLIDYNNCTNRIGIGIMINDWK